MLPRVIIAVIREKLVKGLNKLRLEHDNDTLDKLVSYVELLEKWNKAYNLISTESTSELIGRHVLDSLLLGRFLPAKGVMVDIGSGAGFPGIPLAITNPKQTVILVDSNGKKTRFMQQCAVMLRLYNVSVKKQRIESLAESSYDVVTARAVAPLKILLPLSEPLLREGGILLAQKGIKVEQEFEEIDEKWMENVFTCELPTLQSHSKSLLVSYQKPTVTDGELAARY